MCRVQPVVHCLEERSDRDTIYRPLKKRLGKIWSSAERLTNHPVQWFQQAFSIHVTISWIPHGKIPLFILIILRSLLVTTSDTQTGHAWCLRRYPPSKDLAVTFYDYSIPRQNYLHSGKGKTSGYRCACKKIALI